jgi:hypothetical protein
MRWREGREQWQVIGNLHAAAQHQGADKKGYG